MPLPGQTVQVLPSSEACPSVAMLAGEGFARAVAWPGVGASLRSMIHVRLEPGAATRSLAHEMEAVYYVISGSGSVADGAERQELVAGSMAFVEPGTEYTFEAGGGGMELVGGPCPADPALFEGL